MVDDDPKASHPFTVLSAAGLIGVTRTRIRLLAHRQNIGIVVSGRAHQIRRFTAADVEQMRLMLTGPKGRTHEAWLRKHEDARSDKSEEQGR